MSTLCTDRMGERGIFRPLLWGMPTLFMGGLLLILLVSLPGVARGELRVWTDDEGVLHMSNVPPARPAKPRTGKGKGSQAAPSPPKQGEARGPAPAAAPAPTPTSAPAPSKETSTPNAGASTTRLPGVVGFNQLPATEAAPPGTPGLARPAPERTSKAGRYRNWVALAAQTYSLPPELIYAVMRVESNFNPDAVSRAGAQGLMQLMPATAAYLGVEDSFNPAQNIMGGTRYLRELADRFSGDIVLVLAAYNAGQGAVSRSLGVPYDDTEWYVRHVLKFFHKYQEEGLP